ncbi:MAG: hypothetical protein QM669_01100 [Siphonobacter sp.]
MKKALLILTAVTLTLSSCMRPPHQRQRPHKEHHDRSDRDRY